MSIELKASVRDRVGKGAARELRRNGLVPAVIYGDKKAPLSIAVSYKDTFRKIHDGGFLSHVIEIDVDGEKHRVIPKDYQLEPVQAAWNIGAMIRWLDFNDTWLAAEWGHPSDNLGALLALTDYLDRGADTSGHAPIHVEDLLRAMIQAHEIQGVLALENSFNRVGLDHVLLVRIASTAVATRLLGGGHSAIHNCGK